jgi:hypothetical protein
MHSFNGLSFAPISALAAAGGEVPGGPVARRRHVAGWAEPTFEYFW